MAKSTKQSGKRFSSKVNKIVKSDVFTSVAILSVLLNIFLLVGVFVLTNTDTYNTGLFTSVRSRYCDNIDGVVKRSLEIGDSKTAVNEWKVNCVSDDFLPYYNEAVKKFEASTK